MLTMDKTFIIHTIFMMFYFKSKQDRIRRSKHLHTDKSVHDFISNQSQNRTWTGVEVKGSLDKKYMLKLMLDFD